MKFRIPSRKVGLLIGPQYRTINAIRNRHLNATINIGPRIPGLTQEIEIIGN